MRSALVKASIRKFSSDVYTHGYAKAVVNQHARRTANECASYLLPHIKPNDKLLDVGCGPGSITKDFAAIVKHGHVHAIDYGQDVIAEAEVTLSGVTNVTLACESVYQLPYADGTFNVVHAHQVLQHLTDPVAALKEMYRVTKPGGVIGVRDADYASMLAAPEVPMMAVWRDMYHKVCERNNAFPDAGRYLKGWAIDAGFSNEKIENFAQVTCYTEKADVENWGNSLAERVSTTLLGDQAVQYGISTRDEINEMAKAWRDWTREPGAFFYYVNGYMIIHKS